MRPGRSWRSTAFPRPNGCRLSLRPIPGRPARATIRRLLIDRGAHDRARGAAAGDLAETGLAERRREAGPGEGGRDVAPLRIDRVPLDDAPAAQADVIDRGAQERRRDAGPPVVPTHEQAGDRPDRLAVDGAQDAGILEPRIAVAARQRAPGDRLVAIVGQKPRHLAIPDDLPERPAIAGPLAGLVLPARALPVHAPASGAGAARAEQTHEVGPAIGGERSYRHALRVGRRVLRALHARTAAGPSSAGLSSATRAAGTAVAPPRRPRMRFRNAPVCERGLRATSSGVPSAMIWPPSSPPSGPRSRIQSAVLMTSRLCSMTITVFPWSTS